MDSINIFLACHVRKSVEGLIAISSWLSLFRRSCLQPGNPLHLQEPRPVSCESLAAGCISVRQRQNQFTNSVLPCVDTKADI